MNLKILPFLALVAFAAAPIVIGSAEQAKKEEAKKEEVKKGEKKDAKKDDAKKEASAKKEGDAQSETEEKIPAKASTECLASEEVIQDLELREKKLKEKEEAIKEKETELDAQQVAIKDEMAKLEGKRAEIQGIHQKELAEREEQVNKLIETFEGMSPKSAAQVIGGVDDELAVMALSKLSSVKAGKILGNLKPEKSAKLSEMMAYGQKARGKEATRGESDRSPASKH